MGSFGTGLGCAHYLILESSGDFMASSGNVLAGSIAFCHCRSSTTVLSMHSVLRRVRVRCLWMWGEPKLLQHERRDDQCIGDPVSLSQARKATYCTWPHSRTWGFFKRSERCESSGMTQVRDSDSNTSRKWTFTASYSSIPWKTTKGEADHVMICGEKGSRSLPRLPQWLA